MNTAVNNLFQEAGIPLTVLSDRPTYINTARSGVSGSAIKTGSKRIDRALFIKLMNTSSSNLSRLYSKKSLNTSDSEEILDTFCVVAAAIAIWDDIDRALVWLNTPIPALAGDKPIDLFDTFSGRKWVSEVLSKIEQGEFS